MRRSPSAAERLRRARGALTGLALGDALGMPTQSLPRAQIVARWGAVLGGFEPGPPDQPLAPGLPAGSVTDDTEQAVLLGRLLVDGRGRVDALEFARRLMAWEDSMRARGSLDLLGPSTKTALAKLLDGVPVSESGNAGTTNGAAMRVAPIGIAFPLDRNADPFPPDRTASSPGLSTLVSRHSARSRRIHIGQTRTGPCDPAQGYPLDDSAQDDSDGSTVSPLLEAVVAASRPTHNTSIALAGAAAVAAAVSVGIDGGDTDDAVRAAIDAARTAADLGHWIAAADVATRIERLAARGPRLAESGPDAFLDWVDTVIGTSLATQESVPAAFAFVIGAGDDPWLALRLAASVGGDCDTIAAMAGAVLGACHGVDAFPAAERTVLAEVNGLDLDGLAADLLALRHVRADEQPTREDAVDPCAPGPRRAPMVGETGQTRSQIAETPAFDGKLASGHEFVPFATHAWANDAPRLIHTGNAVVDLVVEVPALPPPGGDVLARSSHRHAGGGVNVMVAAARHGLSVVYAGVVGAGPNGDLVRDALATEGVALPRQSPEPVPSSGTPGMAAGRQASRAPIPPADPRDTGLVLALVNDDGERTFVTIPGAEATLSVADLSRAPVTDDWVYVTGYSLAHDANRAALLAWLPTLPPRTKVLFDPGPLVTDLPKAAVEAVLTRADWCSANRAEAHALTGADDPAQAARRLAGRARQGAVVRLGAGGCLVATGGKPGRSVDCDPALVPGFAVDAVDLNGAGDTHVGAFVAALSQGADPVAAALRANAAAALAVTRRGPATAPTAAEVDAFLSTAENENRRQGAS